jgi:Uma2 family endonuclease
MTMATTRLVTAEELMAMGEDARYELLDGELVEMAPASSDHGVIAYRLATRVDRFEPSRELVEGVTAEAGFVLRRDPDVLVAPDIAFVRRQRVPPAGRRSGAFEFAPDIAVEIISPSDRPTRIARKVSRYLQAGTELVWLVDPRARTVTVHQRERAARVLAEHELLDGGDVIPGFQVRVGELFD